MSGSHAAACSRSNRGGCLAQYWVWVCVIVVFQSWSLARSERTTSSRLSSRSLAPSSSSWDTCSRSSTSESALHLFRSTHEKIQTDMRYLARHRRAPVNIWAHRAFQSLFNNKIRPLQNSPIQIKPTQLKVDLGLCVTRSVPSAFKSNSWGRPGKSFVCSSSIPVPLLTRAYSFWLYWVPLQKAGAVNPRLEFELVLL